MKPPHRKRWDFLFVRRAKPAEASTPMQVKAEERVLPPHPKELGFRAKAGERYRMMTEIPFYLPAPPWSSEKPYCATGPDSSGPASVLLLSLFSFSCFPVPLVPRHRDPPVCFFFLFPLVRFSLYHRYFVHHCFFTSAETRESSASQDQPAHPACDSVSNSTTSGQSMIFLSRRIS
jgi:hypothetical protein